MKLPTTIISLFAAIFGLCPFSYAAEQDINITAGEKAAGILTHQITSPYQAGTTELRVLLPDDYKPSEKYPIVYVLPVEAGREAKYGDGLNEVKKLGLHNKHRAIFAAPTFSALPWYADHPTDAKLRQETYFVTVVVPFIDKTYQVEGRYLLGFSKSGWGAWSLLLRHPTLFERAAAWDAPLLKEKPDQFGMGPIFGTQENFELYQLTKLLAKQKKLLTEKTRLVLTGYDNFRTHHEGMHKLLDELQIKHEYRDGPRVKHVWESGWVEEAVGLLLKV
jgi:enterochelin esterase-like enzyme